MAASLVRSLGTAIRTAGQAIDNVGAAMQGRFAYRETCKLVVLLCMLQALVLLSALAMGTRQCVLHHEQLVPSAVPKHQTLQAYANKRPQLADDIFVAPNSSMIGDVSLGKSSSVWYGAVLRGVSS